MFCKDANRPGSFEATSFDFLGYTFRGRLAKGPRGYFVSFSPAWSAKAKKAVGQKIRAWHLRRRSDKDLSDLARDINAQVRGWIAYYGAFYRSELYSLALRIDHRPAPGPMGHAQVQTTPQQVPAGMGMADARAPAPTQAVRPLAPCGGRPTSACGSPVS